MMNVTTVLNRKRLISLASVYAGATYIREESTQISPVFDTAIFGRNKCNIYVFHFTVY